MSLASFLSRTATTVRRDGVFATLRRLEARAIAAWLIVRLRHYGRLVAAHGLHPVRWATVWTRDRLEYPAVWVRDRLEYPATWVRDRLEYPVISMRDRTEPLWGPLFHVGTRFQATRTRFLILIRSPAAVSHISARLDSPYAFCHVAPRLSDTVLINGWALCFAGVESVEAFLDEQSLGFASRGVHRPDLAGRFSFIPESWQGGFILPWDTTAHADGSYGLSIRIVGRRGNESWLRCPVVIDNTVRAYDEWVTRRPDAGVAAPRPETARSVDLLVDATCGARADLEATVASLGPAPSDGLRVIVATPPGMPAPEAHGILVVPTDGTDPGRRLADLLARGDADWVGVLSPGDRLAAGAIDRLLDAAQGGVDLVYGDEDRVDDAGRRVDPFFKPAWSPDLLASRNYVGRPWLARRSAIAALAASQEPDPERGILLGLADSGAAVVHVPDVLCSRPVAAPPGGTPARKAVPAPRPAVSLVIATRAGSPLIRRCLTAIAEHTRYPDLEIVVLDNARPGDSEARRFLDAYPARRLTPEGPFNWSAFNNAGAAAARGEVLVFLNDDIEPTDDAWLDPLLAHALADGVGPVGAKLLYGDDAVQHAGIFLTDQGGGGRHAFRYLRADAPGYQGLAETVRNCAAVTGACLMIRRDRFEALGRFDEALSLTNNDVDFCLRAWTKGFRTVYTPHTRLYHHERATRRDMSESDDIRLYRARWQWLYRLGDPFHNPNLRTDRDDLAIDPDARPAPPRDSRLWTTRS